MFPLTRACAISEISCFFEQPHSTAQEPPDIELRAQQLPDRLHKARIRLAGAEEASPQFCPEAVPLKPYAVMHLNMGVLGWK